jgi:hypothetical protein
MPQPFRLASVALAALAAIPPITACAAEDTRQMLIEHVLQLFGPDAHITGSANGIIVTGGSVVLPDGGSAPARELTCDSRSMMLRDRAAATSDLYPVQDGFCETLAHEFVRRNGGGRP